MKRLVHSEGYARARLVSGALFVVLGSILIVRTIFVVGASFSAVPAYVLGAAMIALGALRYRDYFAYRAQR